MFFFFDYSMAQTHTTCSSDFCYCIDESLCFVASDIVLEVALLTAVALRAVSEPSNTLVLTNTSPERSQTIRDEVMLLLYYR
jgi:hypothetical protein